MDSSILEDVAQGLPSICFRKDLGRLTHGMLNPKTLANLYSLGLGIPGKFKVGKRVAYTRDAVIQYLKSIIREVDYVA